jgi:hypothetical protein
MTDKATNAMDQNPLGPVRHFVWNPKYNSYSVICTWSGIRRTEKRGAPFSTYV